MTYFIPYTTGATVYWPAGSGAIFRGVVLRNIGERDELLSVRKTHRLPAHGMTCEPVPHNDLIAPISLFGRTFWEATQK